MTSCTVYRVGAAFSYSIVHVPHDEAGIRKYINEYKAFRLLSLQLAPEAFGSTYAREITFDDDVWYTRLASPARNTFIAVTDTGEIISSSTMMGPLPVGPEKLPPASDPWIVLNEAFVPGEGRPSHFRLNAVFTLPEARRKGISKALIEHLLEHLESKERAKGRSDPTFSVVVDTDNHQAKALYQSVGFIEMKKLTAAESAVGRPVELLIYKPAPVS